MSDDAQFPFRKGDTFGEGPHPDDTEGMLVQAAIHATDSMIVIGDMGREDEPLVFVNDYFCEFTGYTRDEVLGRNCRFLQRRADGSMDQDQPGLNVVRRALKEGRSARVVLRNYRKDGRPFWNELFLSPIRGDRLAAADGDGRGPDGVTHFVGVQNDVTARVEGERDLRLLDMRWTRWGSRCSSPTPNWSSPARGSCTSIRPCAG